MSGSVIGAIVLWLIVAIIVIAVVVYLVNWLYRRSTKEVSFVRTGLGGEKVVIDGGAFVLPIIHETTPVNMNVVQLEVVRDKENALITKDRMRVDMVAEFYVRVAPTREAVLDGRRDRSADARWSRSGCTSCSRASSSVRCARWGRR